MENKWKEFGHMDEFQNKNNNFSDSYKYAKIWFFFLGKYFPFLFQCIYPQ